MSVRGRLGRLEKALRPGEPTWREKYDAEWAHRQLTVYQGEQMLLALSRQEFAEEMNRALGYKPREEWLDSFRALLERHVASCTPDKRAEHEAVVKAWVRRYGKLPEL